MRSAARGRGLCHNYFAKRRGDYLCLSKAPPATAAWCRAQDLQEAPLVKRCRRGLSGPYV
jgi:hypothetical protein